MAGFGSSSRVKAEPGTNQTTSFEKQFVETREGSKRLRMLPILDDDGSLFDPDGTGRGVTESEVRYAEQWWPVMVNGKPVNRPIIVSSQNVFDNPFWRKIDELYPKPGKGEPKNEKRKPARCRFAMNVLNKTLVIFLPDGTVVYPNLDEDYFILKDGKPVAVQGDPVPLNRVQILSASDGEDSKTAKHIHQQLIDLNKVMEPSNKARGILRLHEFDLRFKRVGTGERDTTYSMTINDDFSLLTVDEMFLPRYDIESWATPMPDEAIERLLNREDYNEICKEYEIVLFPRLREVIPF